MKTALLESTFSYFVLYFFAFFFFFLVLHRNVERGLHLEAPSCKVPHVSIKISRHIEIMSIYVSSDYASSEEGLLHHIRALVGRGKFSSMIRHGLVMLFQDWATFFKDSGSKLLVKLLLDTSLVQLSMAHCVMRFLPIMFNYSYRERVHLASDFFVNNKILRDGIFTSTRRMNFMS